MLVGWPAAIYLVLAANYHRTRIGTENEEGKTEESREQEVNPANGDSNRKYSQSSSPPKSINLERETYMNEF